MGRTFFSLFHLGISWIIFNATKASCLLSYAMEEAADSGCGLHVNCRTISHLHFTDKIMPLSGDVIRILPCRGEKGPHPHLCFLATLPVPLHFEVSLASLKSQLRASAHSHLLFRHLVRLTVDSDRSALPIRTLSPMSPSSLLCSQWSPACLLQCKIPLPQFVRPPIHSLPWMKLPCCTFSRVADFFY